MSTKNGSTKVHGSEAAHWGGWSWGSPRRTEHFRRCSYCGCVHPDDLAEAIDARQAGAPAWADRKYGWPHKFYVDIVKRNADEITCIGSRGGGDPSERYEGYVHVSELTAEQRAVALRDGQLREDDDASSAASTWLMFGTQPTHFGKFYTAHLADPDITDETKAKIAAWSGLAFTFTDDGRVSWRAAS